MPPQFDFPPPAKKEKNDQKTVEKDKQGGKEVPHVLKATEKLQQRTTRLPGNEHG